MRKTIAILFIAILTNFQLTYNAAPESVRWKISSNGKTLAGRYTGKKNETANNWIEGKWVKNHGCKRYSSCYVCKYTFYQFLSSGNFKAWTETEKICPPNQGSEHDKPIHSSQKQEKLSGNYKLIDKNVVELNADGFIQ